MADDERLPEVAAALATILGADYLDVDVGSRAAAELGVRAHTDGGDAVGRELAALLTTWAQGSTDDRHVTVRYLPDGAPSEQEAKAAFLTSFRARAAGEN
jgi:hypothetical protein